MIGFVSSAPSAQTGARPRGKMQVLAAGAASPRSAIFGNAVRTVPDQKRRAVMGSRFIIVAIVVVVWIGIRLLPRHYLPRETPQGRSPPSARGIHGSRDSLDTHG